MGFAKELAVKGALLVSLPWAGRMTWQMHEEVRRRQTLAGTNGYRQYSDLWEAALVVAVLVPLQMAFRSCFAGTARLMVPKKQRWSQSVWDAKVMRWCDAVFKCVYFIAMMATGWWLLRNEAWMPPALGGSGHTRFCWTDGYPLQPVSPGLRRFYLASLGFHLSEVAMLMQEIGLPDFWEMLLHHTISSNLVFFSFMLNNLRIGSLVLVLHGTTDILIYLSKVFVDTKYTRCTGVAYIGLVVSYAYFRIFVFPFHVMKSAWVESRLEAGISAYGWGYFNFGLITLLTLHMYWFGLIVKIGLLFRRSGQARDLHANLSSMDVKNEKKFT